MIACFDVAYGSDGAVAAGVLFRDFPDAVPVAEQTTIIDAVEPYVPGQFYRRELPCILALLSATRWKPDIILIDGYVHLDDQPGLGAHLHAAVGGIVIGVAKTRFGNAGLPVLRGTSKTPLYVTAVGMDVRDAAEHVRAMHGASRIPTMIKRADRLGRLSS
ncbi:MAG TPA: endonuclease V [Thermoanaerobaculia bacterium]|nr:endonuclease V [Thermoanaerobaculia bacterium]